MKFKFYPAMALFIGSYFPLSFILWFRNIHEDTWNSSFCSPSKWGAFQSNCFLPRPVNEVIIYSMIATTLISLILLYIFLKKIKSKGEVQIISFKSIPNDLINYVFPYVVSFMGLDVSKVGEMVGFLIFLVFMFLITYFSGQILMNPFLLLFGWKLYEVEGKISGETIVFKAISNEHLEKNEKIGTRLAQDMYILKKQ